MNSKNKQIEEFLTYYYSLSTAPKYGVLIKGPWGSGKSWFIDNSLKQLDGQHKRHLFVSLYGVTSTREIEDEFFRQLHPVLSSKGMALAGRVVKGLLKGTLNFDWNGDTRTDASAQIGVPDLNVPDYLRNTAGLILVFDDLERCAMPIPEVLGYINHFVEHDDYKVVVIANEDEILSQNGDGTDTADALLYRRTKEKLIGKTFEVQANFDDAIAEFLKEVPSEIKKFVADNVNLVRELYQASGYKNLRHLRQALLEFSRLAGSLEEPSKSHGELLKELLSTFLIYSFEIKCGSIKAEDIKAMKSDYIKSIATSRAKGEDTPFMRLAKKYPSFSPLDSLLSQETWFELMSTGLLDRDTLSSSLTKSKYFRTTAQPEWERLWAYYVLSDDELVSSLRIVLSKFDAGEYDDLSIFEHVVGTLLSLSSLGILDRSREQILTEARASVVMFAKAGKLRAKPEWRIEALGIGAYGRQFHSAEDADFKCFREYLRQQCQQAVVAQYPRLAADLIEVMKVDPARFARMLVHTNHEDEKYFRTPILAHARTDHFVSAFLGLSAADGQIVTSALTERYKFDAHRKVLSEELPWLRNLAELLAEAKRARTGKISAYRLGNFIEDIEASIASLSEPTQPREGTGAG